MSYWEIREDLGDYGRGLGMRESDEYERGYKDGCRHGYEKAMREAYQMGERGGYGMGERRAPYYPDPMGMREPMPDELGERRRRDSRGRWM